MPDLRAARAVPPNAVVPTRVERAVQRPRLAREFVAGAAAAGQAPDVLLVCAPAGYGKTTVLAEVREELRSAAVPVPVAWVGCPRAHDGNTFWTAVLAAVQEAAGESAAVIASLSAPSVPADPAFVSSLLDAVRAEAPGLVLVLDDVHEVTDRDVLDALRLLVEWADGSLRPALGCRFEPPVGLHRLRLTGRLHEVRAAELAFTADEADTLWGLHGLALDAKARTALLALTEGWPAGLALVNMSLENGADPAQFVARFGATDRALADYLAGEVLARLPSDVVDFLIRTSVVEEVPVGLATSLSGCDDAAARLEALARRNAFVTQLDRRGTRFRYHALLRAYLTAALRRRHPREVTRLHRVAAQWYLEQDRPGDALGHACTAGDSALVDRILRERGLALLLAGDAGSLRQSIGMLPAAVRGTPAVLVHRAIMAVDDGDLLEADEALTAVSVLPDDGADSRMTSLRRAAALHRARLAADLDTARGNELIAGEGSSRLPVGLDADVRLLVLGDRGALRLFDGDYEGAREDFERAIGLARAAGLPAIELYCTNQIAGTHIAHDDFSGAQAAAEDAIRFATSRGLGRSPTLAYSYALAAWASFQMLRPQDAAARAELAMEALGSRTADVDVEVEGTARTTSAIIAFDDPVQHRSALDQLDRVTHWLTKRGASPTLTALPALHELRMCVTLGEWRRADHAVARAEQRLGPAGEVAVMRAQLACARGRLEDAGRLLAPVLRGDVPTVRSTTLTSAWLLEAIRARHSGRHPASTDALRTALHLAAPTGAMRPFLDVGSEVHAMLAGLTDRAGHLEPFLATVLASIPEALAWRRDSLIPPPGDTQRHPNGPPGGPLTRRELDILSGLATMATFTEIATAKGIGLNTVKTHARTLYAKLGVGSRREAVAAARTLGLL